MNYFDLPLFRGISLEEQDLIKNSGCIRQKQFDKNETIFHMGDQIRELGIVLSGSVTIENTDLWGNRSILSSIGPGQIFAETYALCREPMLVSAVAAEPSEILFFHLEALLDPSSSAAAWPAGLTRNLLFLSARKNLTLSGRIFCTTPKTIRERLLVYLSEQSAKAGSTSFHIPFDRQELADYLNLDRSALSKELGRMKKEGILEFHKNHFILHHISG